MPVPNHFVGKHIANGRIELVSLLGEGSYGCVYRGILCQDGVKKPCAIKCLAKATLDAYHLMCQRREILLHKQVSYGDGIVTLYEAFEDSDYQWIVMEYCPDGDLWEKISDGHYAGKDDHIRDVFMQILDAVEYCHSKHVFHRDIKPENILLTDGGHKVLLADFGLASGSPVSNELRCGSPWYMSPECWGGIINTNQPYATAPNDVWCLGILLINMACGRHAPWKHATIHDMFFRDFMKRPDMLRLVLPLSPQIHDLLARIFVIKPSERISIQDFRKAVSNIRCFTTTDAKRDGFHDYQKMPWSTASSSMMSRPRSTEINPSVSLIPGPFSDEGEDGVDITEAANDHTDRVARKAKSFIRRIPVIDTGPQGLHTITPDPISPCLSTFPPAFRNSSSSCASADSFWLVTPPMAPVPDVDVEFFDISEDIGLERSSGSPEKLSRTDIAVAVLPFQNILRTIGAL